MPKFKKSTGYKMKGFSGFKSSPAKQVTDADIRAAVGGVDKEQMAFRQPGWAKAAEKAWSEVSGKVEKLLDPANLLKKRKEKSEKEDKEAAEKKS